MPIDVRPIAPGDLEAFSRAFYDAFLETPSPRDVEGWQRTWERTGIIQRTIAAQADRMFLSPVAPWCTTDF